MLTMQLAVLLREMPWFRSHRFDKRALPLADRHYNRQKPGTPQFVPPGKNLVLLTEDAGALWVTSWPNYTRHAWRGAWINTLFRRESGPLASYLIRAAVSATIAHFGNPPVQGMITFIDAKKTKHKRDPGRCYVKAGFRHVGFTKVNHLVVMQLLPQDMPLAVPARTQIGNHA